MEDEEEGKKEEAVWKKEKTFHSEIGKNGKRRERARDRETGRQTERQTYR